MRPPAADDAERGDAVIEFVGLAVVVLIPLIYLVLTLAAIQGAALATQSGAREAERILAAEPTQTELAQVAVNHIVADQGVRADTATLTMDCEGPCGGSGAATVTVSTRVRLPLVPPLVAGHLPAEIPVSAHTAVFFTPGKS